MQTTIARSPFLTYSEYANHKVGVEYANTEYWLEAVMLPNLNFWLFRTKGARAPRCYYTLANMKRLGLARIPSLLYG